VTKNPRAKPRASKASSEKTDSSVTLEAVINSVLDGIITIDAKGTVETFNRAAERIFGYSLDEVIGQNVKMLMPAPFADEHDGYLKNYTDTGVKKIIGIGREVVGRRSNGTVFPLDLAVTEMPTTGARKFVGIVRDISEKKESENLIARQSDALMELSTPAIKIWDSVVLLPLIGVIDTNRAQQIIENLLESVVENEARVVIVDVTGVPIIDTTVAQHLLKTIGAAGMLGARVILTGISPEIAQTLVRLRVDFSDIHTCGTLRAGVGEALASVGMQVIAK